MKILLKTTLFLLLINALYGVDEFDFLKNEIKAISITTDKEIYNVEDVVKMKIDTKGKEGYLYLFVLYGDDFLVAFPNRLYKNSLYLKSGKYEFPQSFSKLDDVFKYEASNDSSFAKERTKVVAVLSEKELPVSYESKKKDIFMLFNRHSKKAKKLVSLFKGLIIRAKKKKEHNIFATYSIFWVKK